MNLLTADPEPALLDVARGIARHFDVENAARNVLRDRHLIGEGFPEALRGGVRLIQS